VVRSNDHGKTPALLGVFLSRHGRLPAFAHRRVDSLISKQKIEGLTREEQRELAESLTYIDNTSIELLAYAAERARASRKAPAAELSRLPLWKRYIERRLNELCSR
jgi:hypothetical protein